MAQNEYRGLILTNHLLDRMKERGITKDYIWETYTSPDKQDTIKDADRRMKKFGNSSVTIVFKHNEKRQVVIISAWIDPPLPGSKDAKQKEWFEQYKKAGMWGKIWLSIIKQVRGY
ncbi:MAG: DUF4258 domain-containing protein [Candidatus Levybacteria bacterium]|nr:DUF4258 domain-containing protein [Candidatus Levybacteria bacterium]